MKRAMTRATMKKEIKQSGISGKKLKWAKNLVSKFALAFNAMELMRGSRGSAYIKAR